MSDLTFNKIAGAVLATGLVVFGLQQVSQIVFKKEPPEKPGYAIAIAAGPGEAAAVADTPPDWGTVLPKADVAAGQDTSAKCASCHKFDPAGSNSTGPGLFGVLGRAPGSHPGFTYDDAMKTFAATNKVWDYDHLYMFLAGPQNYMPGTKMTFAGLKGQQDRINLIAYLHTLGSNLPIPAPKPAAATPTPVAGEAAKPGAAANSAAPTNAAAPTATNAAAPAK